MSQEHLDFITLSVSGNLPDLHASHEQTNGLIKEEVVASDVEGGVDDAGYNIFVDHGDLSESKDSCLSNKTPPLQYNNTCQVPYPDRVNKTEIDEYILYMPDLKAALLLWSQVSIHPAQCSVRQRPRRRRSSQVSSSLALRFGRMRRRILFLTEFNEDLFSKQRRKKPQSRAKKQRRSSYIATHIMAKHHLRDQEKNEQKLRNVLGEGAKRRSSAASVTFPLSESPLQTSQVSIRCWNCDDEVCSCRWDHAERDASSAPCPRGDIESSSGEFSELSSMTSNLSSKV